MLNYFLNLFKKSNIKNENIPIKEDIPLVIESNEFRYYIKNDLKVTYDLRIGDNVIVVGNEKDSVHKGVITSFEQITKAKNIVPLVKMDRSAESLLCFGVLIPFDQEMYHTLIKLSKDKSAWNYISPSWCQIDGSKKFRKTENSLILRK